MQIETTNVVLHHINHNGHHQKMYKQCRRGYREKGTLLCSCWECTDTATVEGSMEVR